MAEQTLFDCAPPVNEVWRPVVGYEGFYEVSNLGRIRRDAAAKKIKNSIPGKVIEQMYHKGGYRQVTASVNAKRKTLVVHSVVAAAFLGPCPAGKEVNHKDYDRANSAAENLEYLTPEQNREYSLVNIHRGDNSPARRNPDRLARGTAHGMSKLTDSDILAIRCRLANHESQESIARDFHVSQTTVGRISRGQIWKHVA